MSAYPQQEEEQDVDVVTFLQKAGEQYQQHIKLLRQEKRQEELAEMRSKPVICPYDKITNRDRGKVGDRLHKLWERRKANEEALRKKEAGSRQQEENENCTFRPGNLTKAAKQLPSRGSQGHISQEFLRKHQEKIEKLRTEALRKEVEEVVPRSHSVRSKSADPAEDHRHGMSVEDFLLMKEAVRQKRLYDLVEEQQNAGKPMISERAQKLERPGDVVSRLYDPDFRPVAFEENPPTFHPQIHSDYDDPLEQLPVHERVLRREVKHQSRIASERYSPDAKPMLSDVSQNIVRSRREAHPDEDAASPGSRLYKQGMKKMVEKEHLTAHERDSRNRFSYKPQLTQQSEKIVKSKRNKTPHQQELYDRWKRQEEEKKKRISKMKAEEEAEKMKECTFTPTRRGVSPIAAVEKSQDFSGWMEKSSLWERNRRSKLHTSRVEQAETELEQCTFQPLIHHEVPVVNEPKMATGVSDHVKRLANAREDRERRVEQLENGSTTPSKRHSNHTPRRHTNRGGGGGGGGTPGGAATGGNRSTSQRTHHQSSMMSQGTPFSQPRKVDAKSLEALKPPVNRYDVPEPLFDDGHQGLGYYYDEPPQPQQRTAPRMQQPQQQAHHPGPSSRSSSKQQGQQRPNNSNSNRQHVDPYQQQYQHHQQPQQLFTPSQHHQGTPPSSGGGQYNPSPVDFILQNHQAIVRGFRRQ